MDFQKEEPKVDVITAIERLGYENNYWNVFLYSKSTDWNEAVADPENYGAEFKDRILSRVSVALFFLLPLFTLFVSLLYIRRKFNYTENLVFVFHVQTVFFLLLLLFIIIGRIAHSNSIVWIFLIIFMIHLFMSMRQFYQQGRIKTLIKYIILNSAFMIMASIGAIIISFIAFML
jgi:cation transport ATPase